MNPENILSTLLVGNDFDYVLFKTAIFFAELGLNVWFISPEAFEKIPDNVVSPEKEILQLITFFYLKDYKDLCSHLNSIHLWHKIPTVIVLSGFDAYCNLYGDNYNSLLTALLSTTLLDSLSVCTKKKQKPSYLILTCSHPPDDCKNRLQVLHDTYFPHIINKACDDDKLLLNNIINYFSDK